jgi:hypothetical protein
MPAGNVFAGAFFLLLSLAALTSSISLLQPVLAFLEEAFQLRRARAVTALALLLLIGTTWVWYFSKDLKALDTMDFWAGSVGIFLLGTIVITVFSWALGPERGWRELHRGAQIRPPKIYKYVMRYVTPLYLLTIFTLFILANVVGWNFSVTAANFQPSNYVTDLFGGGNDGANTSAQLTAGFLATLIATILGLIYAARHRWRERRSWADKPDAKKAS